MSSSATTTAAPVHADQHAEHYDPTAGKIGMWLFLFTEVLLFGSLFLAFAVYLHDYRWDFQEVSRHLDWVAGGVNTVILLTSSLTMALSIAALERSKRGLSLALQVATILFACGFLVVKSFEWGHKFEMGLWPNSEAMRNLPVGEQVAYGLYFAMTGLHAFHVILGILVIMVAIGFVWARRVRSDRIVFLENVGLYWHLVDVIWIFLFPLFYLIG